jgi:hypothetical protein
MYEPTRDAIIDYYKRKNTQTWKNHLINQISKICCIKDLFRTVHMWQVGG